MYVTDPPAVTDDTPATIAVVVDPGATTIVKSFETVTGGDDESVAVTVKLDEPPAVGVPLITPDTASNTNPAGNPPEDTPHVNGDTPPDATNDTGAYTDPTDPPGNTVVVIANGTTWAVTVTVTGVEVEVAVSVFPAYTADTEWEPAAG